jgi:hypothetical protein
MKRICTDKIHYSTIKNGIEIGNSIRENPFHPCHPRALSAAQQPFVAEGKIRPPLAVT